MKPQAAKKETKIIGTRNPVEQGLNDYEGAASDFDGTAADTKPLYRMAKKVSFNRLAEETGDRRLGEIADWIIDKSFRIDACTFKINRWMLEQVGVIKKGDKLREANELVETAVRYKDEYTHPFFERGVDAIEGAVEFLCKIADRLDGQVVIVTTSSRENAVQPFLVRHDLTDIFPPERIIDGKDVGDKKKPHPEGYKRALGYLGIADPKHLLVFEDNRVGIKAGNRAEAHVAALATTFTVPELERFKGFNRPRYIAPDFSDLAMQLKIAA